MWRSLRLLSAVIGALERIDVELLHLEEGVGDARDLLGVLVEHHVDERSGNDLPGETESVLQPAAGTFLSTLGGELAPEIIDLFLRLAGNLEGDRLVESELRAAVERDEFLPLELEGDHHDRARLLAMDLLPCVHVAADLVDLRVLEDRAIEFRRILG